MGFGATLSLIIIVFIIGYAIIRTISILDEYKNLSTMDYEPFEPYWPDDES